MTDVEIIQGGVLKVDDTAPNLRLRLLDGRGNTVNLAGISTASLSMKRSKADSTKVDDSLSVFDAERGIVEYDWQSGDTDTTGTFEAEVKIDDGTDTASYPNDTYFRVRIMEDLT